MAGTRRGKFPQRQKIIVEKNTHFGGSHGDTRGKNKNKNK
jgi:hypothetical protein